MPVGGSPDTARNHRPGQIILINNTTVFRQKSKQVAFPKKLTSEDNNAMLSSNRVPTRLFKYTPGEKRWITQVSKTNSWHPDMTA